MTTLARAARIIMVGCPGAGKGTQATRLLSAFPGLKAISSGDILRDNVARGTDIGKQANSYMVSGSLVPDSVMVKLILSSLPPATTSYILDGFPRTRTQAEVLSRSVPVNFVVNLDVPHSVILDRIANRWVHPASGRVYNLTFSPPKTPGKDDFTGEPLVRRKDDDPATFKVRLQKYEEVTGPLLEFYREKGILWTVQGRTSDEITPKLIGEVSRRFGSEEAGVSGLRNNPDHGLPTSTYNFLDSVAP
ncbi:mitochondrial GTP:AMP phosphotransferase [Drechslerella stenobrocha 248]|uniref:GTP:AMP phosphotransferase, mitochondrial n=1 Tax=Drechslerella stenobrocha 248 TaxID=1043628 RepID=W7HXP9_9PEZI|nr:mitochondrial GTP:AMP phosphotransferase [Drechslerella stenobrocha 248]